LLGKQSKDYGGVYDTTFIIVASAIFCLIIVGFGTYTAQNMKV